VGTNKTRKFFRVFTLFQEMDRFRRTLGRIPGLSFLAAAALTVALEAAIGIGASMSVASGLPSLHAPKTSGITSTVGSTVSSATSTASSATSTATSAVSSTVHKVTSTASSTTQSLVGTASNLTSTASSTAGQVASSTAGGSPAPTASPTVGAPAASATSSGSTATSGGSQGASAPHSASTGQGSGSQPDASRYRQAQHAAQHPWFVRRLVTRLSGCVDDLPRQSQQVLVLAAGVGSSQPNSPSRVAHILHLSVSRVRQLENSSAVALERASAHGNCESASGALPASAVALGVQPGLALVSGPEAGAQAFLPAAQALGANAARAHKSAVRARHLSRRHGGGTSGSAPVQRSSIGSPAAAGTATAWIFVLLGLLLAAGFLVIGRQRQRARPSGAAAGRGATTGLAGATVTQASTAPAAAPPAIPSPDPSSWEPPAVLGLGAAAAATAPSASEPAAPAAAEPATPSASETATPSASETAAPFASETAVPSEAEPAAPFAARSGASSTPAGRPRIASGRNWLRRHRQAAAMAGAVAGATLAMMVSTAGRSARLLSRRRRRRRWRR
jgi:hypothetical protein